MNSIHTTAAASSTIARSPSLAKWAGVISILQGLLLFVPLIVLGQAINWPQSLVGRASTALPRLLENEGAVRLGYLVYLLYSILFAAAVAMLVRYAGGALIGVLAAVIIGFAVASALARSIGIIRWLAPMPELATLWQSASTDEQRYSISVVFQTLNSFGGTIGEVLGVGLFAFVTLMLLSAGLLRSRAMPRWIGVFGLIAAVGVLASAIELLGITDSIIVTVGTTLVQLWFLSVGVWLLTRGRKESANADRPR